MRRHVLAAALALAALTAHLPALRAPFFFDDFTAIVDNPHVRSLWPLHEALTTPDETSVAGRPLVALTFALNHALTGLDPVGFHAGNLLLHALATLLLFALVRGTLASGACGAAAAGAADGLAAAAALLWAVHPLQTEAVACAVLRTELLVACCLLGVLCAARAGWDRPPGRRSGLHALAVALAFAGVASKEVAVVAPVLVLLYDRCFVAGTFRAALARSGRLYAGLALSWGLLAFLLSGGPRERSVGTGLGVSSWQYLLTQAEVLVHYLRLSLWPAPLTVRYDWPLAGSPADVWAEGVFVLALLALTAWALRPARAGRGADAGGRAPGNAPDGREAARPSVPRRHVAGFLGAWFFVVLAPSSSVVPIVTEVAAERRMYLPLLSVVQLLVAGGWMLQRRRVPFARRRGVALASVALLALLAGAASWARLAVYRDPVSIWSDAVAKQPDGPVCHFQLGWHLTLEGRAEEGLLHHLRSHELHPEYVPNLKGLARCLLDLGQVEAAEGYLLQALALERDDPLIPFDLGLCAARLGRLDLAADRFEQALRLDPGDPDAHSNLALVLLHAGAPHAEVAGHLEAALAADPGHGQALALLAQLEPRGG